MSENPLDAIFDHLCDAAAILEDWIGGSIPEAEALVWARRNIELASKLLDAPIGWLRAAQRTIRPVRRC